MTVIDVHSHIYPPSYIEMLRGRREIPRIDERDGSLYFVIFPEEEKTGGRLIRPAMSSIDEKLAFMAAGGIDQTIVSLGNPWLDPVRGPESVTWARRINAELAGLEGSTGGKIRAMGVLPNAAPQDVAEIATELAATRGLYGAITGCAIGGLTFDDPALEPVWAALEKNALPLLVHPHYAAAVDLLGGFGTALPLGIGFPMETSIAVARLVFAGVLHRHPDLRILVAHSGGVLPFLAARLDVTWRGDAIAQQRLPQPPSTYLAKLWLDTVSYHARAMHAASDLVSPRQLVFGTDHPFFKEEPADIVAGVRGAFSAGDFAALADANAVRLFGLGRTR